MCWTSRLSREASRILTARLVLTGTCSRLSTRMLRAGSSRGVKVYRLARAAAGAAVCPWCRDRNPRDR